MTAKTLTKRQAAKAATRSKLIEAARQGFCALGYDRVTIRDIATAVGVSTGAVFSNFTDKAELFEAAIGRSAPDVRGFLRELSCCAPSTPVGDRAAEADRLLFDLIGEEGARAFEVA